MTKNEAIEYAKTMTFRDAIYNLKQARCIPYKKATFIKINELLNFLEKNTEKELEQLAEYSGKRFNDPLQKEYINILNKLQAESEG